MSTRKWPAKTCLQFCLVLVRGSRLYPVVLEFLCAERVRATVAELTKHTVPLSEALPTSVFSGIMFSLPATGYRTGVVVSATNAAGAMAWSPVVWMDIQPLDISTMLHVLEIPGASPPVWCRSRSPFTPFTWLQPTPRNPPVPRAQAAPPRLRLVCICDLPAVCLCLLFRPCKKLMHALFHLRAFSSNRSRDDEHRTVRHKQNPPGDCGC